MRLYEFQGKTLFQDFGIPVPRGEVARSPGEAASIAGKLGGGDVVVKAQVLTGGRGKAGGILRASTPEEAERAARSLLGTTIRGFRVERVLVEEAVPISQEFYLSVLWDSGRPVVLASPRGGVDIEAAPGELHRVSVDPLLGLQDYQARKLALKLSREHTKELTGLIKKLYSLFTTMDCTLAEINPLALSDSGSENSILALDAKVMLDDSALFRHPGYREEVLDPWEAAAREAGMSYVSLDGDIGCIVNGAGMAMATMDLIDKYGGKPANFLDVRAGARAERITRALQIVAGAGVRGIVVNIFGGLTRCDEVAKGILKGLPQIRVPVVVRLTGTNREEGLKLLEGSGVLMADSSEEAARMVVEL